MDRYDQWLFPQFRYRTKVRFRYRDLSKNLHTQKKKKSVGRLTGSKALLISKSRSNDSTTEKVSRMEDNIAFKFSIELTQGGGSDENEGKK